MRDAKRSGIWPEAQAVHRSAVTKSRKKVSWRLFEALFQRFVELSDELFPSRPEYLWFGMRVFAFDGSNFTLPASEKIRKFFDPESGFGKKNNGSGHYPTCLVSTVYDVFRQIPIARSIAPISEANEREDAITLLKQIPQGGVLLFDRGYPSYQMLYELEDKYDGYYLFRGPAINSFSVVDDFIASGLEDDVLKMHPSNSYRKQIGAAKFKTLEPILLRLIKLVSPDGKVSVLITNMHDDKAFSRQDIINLYFKRWAVETHYSDEKKSMEIERFHSRSVNGVMQELFAAAIMSVIARTLTVLVMPPSYDKKTVAMPQFKHAIVTLSADAIVLVADKPHIALDLFNDILQEIERVKYHKPIIPKKSQPRVNKSAPNKWKLYRKKKMENSVS